MGKILKWLLIGVAGLAVTIVALVVAIVILVDPNDYRDDISRLVKENTGQELVIEGDIELKLFPWLGLDLGRTRLENREGFGDQPFVQIENAGIAVQLLPLLRRELIMDVVRLNGLMVHLVVNERGEANWDIDLPETREDVVAETPPDEPTEGLPVNIAHIAGLEFRDMNIIYEDRQAGTRQQVGPLNMTVGQLDFDRDVPVSADWVATLDPQTRINGKLQSKLRINEGLDQIRVELTRLDLNTFAEGLPSRGLATRASAMIQANLADQTASVSDLVVDTAGLKLNASANVTHLDSEPRVSGSFNIPDVSLRKVLAELGQEVPKTDDADVLKAFSAGGKFNLRGENASIEDLAIRLDDTRFNGGLTVADFSNPMIGFQLVGDKLNADRYLPPGSADEPVVQPTGDGEEEPVELPMEMLRALRLDGSFQLGELIISGITLNDLNLTVKADQGRIRINPVGAKLYSGEYSGDIRVDASGEQARINVDERITNIQSQQIVQQFMGKDLLSGLGNLTLKAEARGVVVEDLLRTLAGQAEFRFADGAVKGLNLAQMMRGATARLQGGRADADAPQETDFTELVGKLTFDGGKIRNESLDAQSPLFRIAGNGVVDMLEQTVDYRLTVNLVGSLAGQGGESLDNLRGIPIPLRFRGSLFSPDISIDLAGALSAQQRERLKAEEEALRQRARDAEGAARERVEQEREKVEERVEQERERVEERVRDRAQDELRRLLR